jgi:hypothetical protein
MSMKIAVFWDVAPYSLVQISRRFRGAGCLHDQDVSIHPLMLEAAGTSETSVNFYQTTRSNNPEDSHLHTRRRENLKSHLVNLTDISEYLCCIRL